MPKAPTDGYEELFLTRREKQRLSVLCEQQGLRKDEKREIANQVLSQAPQQPEDAERLERIKDSSQ